MANDNVIPFTQYLLPDGRAKVVDMKVDQPSTARMASEILMEKGYRFEFEILRTGVVSVTCANTLQEMDIAIDLCANDPVAIKRSVGKVVAEAYRHIFPDKVAG